MRRKIDHEGSVLLESEGGWDHDPVASLHVDGLFLYAMLDTQTQEFGLVRF